MRVVHCKKEAYTHYIGRGPRSIGLQNRYSHRPSAVPGVIIVESVEEALRRFEEDAWGDWATLARIALLPEDAVLGCWCHPKPCHGDVIIRIWHEMHKF